jgi:glycerophosphoryl diester phosphodiesterase
MKTLPAPPLPNGSGRPLVYAHRGGAALRPENTIASFDNGLALGADGLELDVHLTRDGVVVVHHDDTLDRTTDGRGALASCTAEHLARLDAGYWFRPEGTLQHLSAPRGAARPPDPDPDFPFRGCGLSVPLLRDVLARYPGIPIIIELKQSSGELARRTIDHIREANAVDRVALGSFSWRALQSARRYEPRIPTGASQAETRWALYRSWVGWPLRRPAYREFQVPECSGATTIISPRFIEYAHRAGLPVKVWTVNDAGDMRRLLGWGTDALITDRPDLAVPLVRKMGNRKG